MILKIFVLCLVLCRFATSSKCPIEFKPPEECFSVDDVKDYGPTSTAIEALYNRYINLLTEADLTIDDTEVSRSESQFEGLNSNEFRLRLATIFSSAALCHSKSESFNISEILLQLFSKSLCIMFVVKTEYQPSK